MKLIRVYIWGIVTFQSRLQTHSHYFWHQMSLSSMNYKTVILKQASYFYANARSIIDVIDYLSRLFSKSIYMYISRNFGICCQQCQFKVNFKLLILFHINNLRKSTRSTVKLKATSMFLIFFLEKQLNLNCCSISILFFLLNFVSVLFESKKENL